MGGLSFCDKSLEPEHGNALELNFHMHHFPLDALPHMGKRKSATDQRQENYTGERGEGDGGGGG